jgi:transcriptional regulator with XRE-family HTH domain
VIDSAALILDARLDAGLTQRQLASLARTTQSTIAAYETGAKTPGLRTLERILRAAGYELAVERRDKGDDLVAVLDLADVIRASR